MDGLDLDAVGVQQIDQVLEAPEVATAEAVGQVRGNGVDLPRADGVEERLPARPTPAAVGRPAVVAEDLDDVPPETRADTAAQLLLALDSELVVVLVLADADVDARPPRRGSGSWTWVLVSWVITYRTGTWWCSARSAGARARSSRRCSGGRPCSAGVPGWSTLKGEYGDLAAAWGVRPVALRPGRGHPAEPTRPGSERTDHHDGEDVTGRRRTELLSSLGAACLGRNLVPREPAAKRGRCV